MKESKEKRKAMIKFLIVAQLFSIVSCGILLEELLDDATIVEALGIANALQSDLTGDLVMRHKRHALNEDNLNNFIKLQHLIHNRDKRFSGWIGEDPINRATETPSSTQPSTTPSSPPPPTNPPTTPTTTLAPTPAPTDPPKKELPVFKFPLPNIPIFFPSPKLPKLPWGRRFRW